MALFQTRIILEAGGKSRWMSKIAGTGFHFNARKYADDQIIIGTVNPFELFEIFTELVMAGDRANDIAYMLD